MTASDSQNCRAAAVHNLLEAAVRAGQTPGAVAIWSTSEDQATPSVVEVGVTGFGPTGRPTGSRVLYDLASLTKPLVITSLFLVARRAGLVDESTRIGEVLPEIAGSGVGEATVLALLTHRSGLPAWLPLYAVTRGEFGQVITCLAGLDPRPRPPEVVYSCPGFILLGAALEHLLGDGLDRLFVHHVLQPTGLTPELAFCPGNLPQMIASGARTARLERAMTLELGFDPHRVPPVKHGFPDDGNARFLGGVAGNAGLFGTARGVHSLARQYLPRTDSLFLPDEVELVTRNRTFGLEQHRGLGWQIASSPGCSAGATISTRAFGHVGHTGTSVWIDPDRGAVVVLLTNRHHPDHRDHDLHPLRRRLNDLILG